MKYNLIVADIKLYDGTDGFSGFGPLGLQNKNAGESITIFSAFISSAIGLITVIALIWFMFIIVSGALGIISSGGDKNSLESSKKRITSGLIGLIVLISSLFILNLVGKIFGLDLLNISQLIYNLRIQ